MRLVDAPLDEAPDDAAEPLPGTVPSRAVGTRSRSWLPAAGPGWAPMHVYHRELLERNRVSV
jgi:hypothetical protein